MLVQILREVGKTGAEIILPTNMKFSKNKKYYKIILIEEIKWGIIRKNRPSFTPTIAWLK